MLFLFRALFGGKSGPIARAIIGALLVAVGFALHGGAILVAIGVVLLVWGGVGALTGHRTGRQSHVGTGGPVS